MPILLPFVSETGNTSNFFNFFFFFFSRDLQGKEPDDQGRVLVRRASKEKRQSCPEASERRRSKESNQAGLHEDWISEEYFYDGPQHAQIGPKTSQGWIGWRIVWHE